MPTATGIREGDYRVGGRRHGIPNRLRLVRDVRCGEAADCDRDGDLKRATTAATRGRACAQHRTRGESDGDHSPPRSPGQQLGSSPWTLDSATAISHPESAENGVPRGRSVAHVWHTRAEMCHKRREPSATFVQVRRYLSLRSAGLRPTFNPLVVGSSPTGPTTRLYYVARWVTFGLRLMGSTPSGDG